MVAQGSSGWRTVAVVLTASLATACAPRVSLHVPPAAVAELPLERRLALLDDENESLAAQDDRDAQDDRAYRARTALFEARRLAIEAERLLEQVRRDKQPTAVAEAALAEARIRVEFAGQDLDLQRALLGLAETSLLVAEARYELRRATEVEKAGLSGADGVHGEEYRAQIDALLKVAVRREAAAEQQRSAAEKLRARWLEARRELTRLTGGGQGSAWVQ
jgi:hypothetical protein